MLLRRVEFLDESKNIPSCVFFHLFFCREISSNLPSVAILIDGTAVTLLIGTGIPNYDDAMSEIIHLQRDLHASDFAVCAECSFGIIYIHFQ